MCSNKHSLETKCHDPSLTERNDDLVTKSDSSAVYQHKVDANNVDSKIGGDHNPATGEGVCSSSSESDSMTDSCQEGTNHKLEKMWMNN